MLNRKQDRRLTDLNPLKVNPFFERTNESAIPAPPPDNHFLFLSGEQWLLLDGQNLNLLE